MVHESSLDAIDINLAAKLTLFPTMAYSLLVLLPTIPVNTSPVEIPMVVENPLACKEDTVSNASSIALSQLSEKEY
jgi:hypothetical protein